MSSINCICEYLQDPCRYFKPPDPPPHYSDEYIETFRNNYSGWIKYKEECLSSTATHSHSDTQGTTVMAGESRVQQDTGLSTGALIGIVISVIACTLIIIIVVVYLVTHPKKRHTLWNKSRSLFQCKDTISTEEVTFQKYTNVNYLHSKAVKGKCYKNEAFISKDITCIGSITDTAFDEAYTDSNYNQNCPGSNQLTSSSINKYENSPENSHHPDINIPSSKSCLTIVEVNSKMTPLSSDKAEDCIVVQDKTQDTLAKKEPRKKKNHLKRRMDKSKSALIDKAESLGNEKNKKPCSTGEGERGRDREIKEGTATSD
ncbi:hypothetical protein CHS0354_036018 [Potamilus streckersoni]|uniref:Uncharacterized protein n=1 Tax=Potamilus streckersoni TaxID=2493646 RepID=A0AAE0VEQ8_9BIVA|nr:hypothetical protein CHS0354_036018 [Potamilus streckersoni]